MERQDSPQPPADSAKKSYLESNHVYKHNGEDGMTGYILRTDKGYMTALYCRDAHMVVNGSIKVFRYQEDAERCVEGWFPLDFPQSQPAL